MLNGLNYESRQASSFVRPWRFSGYQIVNALSWGLDHQERRRQGEHVTDAAVKGPNVPSPVETRSEEQRPYTTITARHSQVITILRRSKLWPGRTRSAGRHYI